MNGELISRLTMFTNFLCLALTLWFAIYLLSRSHANHLTFRAIVALIALAFYFNSALTIQIAATAEQSPVRSVTTLIALMAGHDLTHYYLGPEQRKKLYPLARGIVMFGVVALILIFMNPRSQPCNPEYVCPTTLTYPWLFVDTFKAFIFCCILYNLWLIKKKEGLTQNITFYLALLAGLGSVGIGIIGTVLSITIPRILPNLFILFCLTFLAYSVARNQTFVSRRTTVYDLPITLLAIAIIVLIYILEGKQLKLSGNELFFIAVLAIFTHSAYDLVRDFLEQLVHRQERQVMKELHSLRREGSTGETLQHYLNRGLAILCLNLRASSGFIAVRQGDQYVVVASLHSLGVGAPFPTKDVVLEGPTQPTSAIFRQIDWLAPAFIGTEQAALIGIGPRKDKTPYGEQDLYWFEDIAHEIGEIIHLHSREESMIAQESLLAGPTLAVEDGHAIDQSNILSAFAYQPDLELVKCVEEGYRHINDYDELGKSPLVALFGIQGNDHIERGKLVHQRLMDILEKLRPAGEKPREPIPSEWYAYTILHDSYVEECLSREIMAKLYIGEGTYYRLRRQALRGITRTLLETGAVANRPAQYPM